MTGLNAKTWISFCNISPTHPFLSNNTQWASSEARARLALQAEGKLDQPVFGVHYDTPENKFDFESVNPDNPFNEADDDDEDEDDEEEEEESEEEDDEE